MPKSIGAQISVEREVWWFLGSKEEHLENRNLVIPNSH